MADFPVGTLGHALTWPFWEVGDKPAPHFFIVAAVVRRDPRLRVFLPITHSHWLLERCVQLAPVSYPTAFTPPWGPLKLDPAGRLSYVAVSEYREGGAVAPSGLTGLPCRRGITLTSFSIRVSEWWPPLPNKELDPLINAVREEGAKIGQGKATT